MPASASAPTSRPRSRWAAPAARTPATRRIGLFSVMRMSDEIKSLTVRRAAESEIAAVAREQGMLSLREDGLTKVRAG